MVGMETANLDQVFATGQRLFSVRHTPDLSQSSGAFPEVSAALRTQTLAGIRKARDFPEFTQMVPL